MTKKSFHSRWIGMLGVLALCSAGCSDDGPADANGDTDAAETGAAEGADSQTSTTGTEPDTTTGADTGDSDEGGNFIDPATDEGSNEPLPNGAECSSNSDCISEFCYTIPGFGGMCSECLSDSDCENTCSLDLGAGYAMCTDGSLGKMCDSTEGCADDLVCAQLFDIGFIDADFCSECSSSEQCDGNDGDDICTPHYDLGEFSGHMYCAAPGSVPDDEGCPIENGEGNGEVCDSGHCGIANVMGFLDLGLCGSCSSDDDCTGEGETCVPASAGEDGIHGPYCD
jgi:hypothetical protein